MNLMLHGIGSIDGEGEPPGKIDDSLRADPGTRFDLVLTNPPFGKKSSIGVINEEGVEEREALSVLRDDFWASTSYDEITARDKASLDIFWVKDEDLEDLKSLP